MKTLTTRLTEPLAAEIAVESRGRGSLKSDIVRERLPRGAPITGRPSRQLDVIADLIGSP